ncbi:hypothetical protein [Nostoc sp.]|uniref:hypothetical protein n=1 Tax=Nostoc sp. TaxID=1180 RepID=UPI002FFAB88D
MSNTPFPQYPVARLNREDIIAYLTPYLEKGWEIYQGNQENQFIVRLLDNLKLFIELREGKWRVSTGLDVDKSLAIWAYPDNLGELDSAIRTAVSIGSGGSPSGTRIEWSSAPTAVRLNEQEPASNLAKLVALIGSSSIEAIFDAYLDNRGLETILNMATLGINISTNIRLLTSTKMVQLSSGMPRMTTSYVRNWLNQLGCNGAKIRHNPYTGHQRRFMLLSRSQSLIVGPSLNNLSVNEASHLEPDTADIYFFNSEWQSAQELSV